MTDPTIALKQYLINIGLQDDADFLREGVKLLSQMVMELEVEQQIGAGQPTLSDTGIYRLAPPM